jgi:hypothetical protein
LLGRPNTASVETFINSGGKSRFAYRTANAQWRFLRKTAMSALSMFATSRNSRLNEIINDAVKKWHDEINVNLYLFLINLNLYIIFMLMFQKNIGKTFDPQPTLFTCVAAIIGRINFGGKYDKDDLLLKLACYCCKLFIFFTAEM